MDYKDIAVPHHPHSLPSFERDDFVADNQKIRTPIWEPLILYIENRYRKRARADLEERLSDSESETPTNRSLHFLTINELIYLPFGPLTYAVFLLIDAHPLINARSPVDAHSSQVRKNTRTPQLTHTFPGHEKISAPHLISAYPSN